MEMAPRLFSIILNVSPWFGRMTFYWSGLQWPFPPYVCVCFHQEMKFLPNVRGKKTDAFERARSSDHSKITEEGEKFARYCYLTVDRSRLHRMATLSCLGDWAVLGSFFHSKKRIPIKNPGSALPWIMFSYQVLHSSGAVICLTGKEKGAWSENKSKFLSQTDIFMHA